MPGHTKAFDYPIMGHWVQSQGGQLFRAMQMQTDNQSGPKQEWTSNSSLLPTRVHHAGKTATNPLMWHLVMHIKTKTGPTGN